MRLLSPLILLLAALGLGGQFAARRYVVDGRSMLQAFAPGDRLMLESISHRLRAPRIGEVVAARQPGAGLRLDLKRIVAGPGSAVTVGGQSQILAEQEFFLLGDNLDESTDSRQLGPIQRKDIVGRFWFKY